MSEIKSNFLNNLLNNNGKNKLIYDSKNDSISNLPTTPMRSIKKINVQFLILR